jgi:outer membrane lipoprotein-sorting protein
MSEQPGRESDLLDAAIAAMRQVPTPDRPPDERVLEGLAQAKAGPPNSISRTLYARIQHMHPAVRYAMVAAIVSAALLIGFGTRSETLLLADVVDAVTKHKTVRFEQKTEFAAPNRNGAPPNGRSKQNGPPRAMTRTFTSYGTLDRMHARVENSNGGIMTLDRAKGIFLNLDPKEKTARVSKFRGTRSTPGILDILEAPEKDKRTTTSVEQLDGADVIVYRLTAEDMKTTIWADDRTKLPVRVEMEQLKGPRQKVVMTRFVWDPPIADPAQFFSVEPPAGYTVETTNLFKNGPPRSKAGARND